MEPICYIVGACPPGEIRFAPGRPAFVIAADKGLVHLEAQGIRPDLIVGDFDSLGRVPAGDNILRHPVEKDDTDTMLAVKTALDRGMGTIVFYGCLGGRLDHTYANLQTLTYLAQRGGQGWLLGDGTVVTAVENGRLDLPAGLRGAVSVFCPDGQLWGSLSGASTTRWRTTPSPAASLWGSATSSPGKPPPSPSGRGPCWSCGTRHGRMS